MKKVTVAIIENNPVLLNNISDNLSPLIGIDVVIKSSEEADFISKVSFLDKSPNFILLGIFKPLSISINLINSIKLEFPNSKIIIIMKYYNEVLINIFIKVGATAYIIKNDTNKQSITDVYIIDEDGKHICTNVFNKISEHYSKLKQNFIYELDKFKHLSKREVQILNYICQAKSSQEISDILAISKRTADTHRNNIIKKTHTKNIIDLVVKAIKLDLYNS